MNGWMKKKIQNNMHLMTILQFPIDDFIGVEILVFKFGYTEKKISSENYC